MNEKKSYEKKKLKFFEELEKSRPIIKEVRGINNKITFFNADSIYVALDKIFGEMK